MSNRVALIVLILFVAVGAGWFWTHRNPPASKSPRSPALVESAAPGAIAAPPTIAAAPPGPAAPTVGAPADQSSASAAKRKLTLADIAQPPPASPVKDVVRQLVDAANQGVPQAACRLGFELIRCARVRNGLVALENAQRAAAAAPKDSREAQNFARDAAMMGQALARDRQACIDIGDTDTADGWRYVYIAATGGSAAAMTRFVRDPGIGAPPGTPEYEEAWGAYKREAPQFLVDAIRNGDVRALYQGYVSALTGNSAGGAGVFARNPEKAIAYAVALRGLREKAAEQQIEQSVVGLIDQVGQARADAARAQGEKLRADFFANATPLNRSEADKSPDVAECWK
jgi:hypothetical protein